MSMRAFVRAAVLVTLVISPLSARDDLRFGDRLPIAEPALGPAAYSQAGARAASDGRDYLVAWYDERVPSSLRYTIVSATGVVASQTGVIARAGYWPLALFWTGDSYTVVAVTSAGQLLQYILIRVAADGTLLDDRILQFTGDAVPNDIVFWNGEFVFLVNTYGESQKLTGYRFDRTGAPVAAPVDIPLPAGTAIFWATAARTDGPNLPIAWYGEVMSGYTVTRGIWAEHLDRDLHPVTGTLRVIDQGLSGQGNLAIGNYAEHDLVAWNDSQGPLRAVFVSPTGIEQPSFLLADTNAVQLQSGSIVAEYGIFHLVLSRYDRDSIVREMAVEPHVGVRGAHDISVSTQYASEPLLTASGGGFLATWNRSDDVYAAVLTSNGTPQGGRTAGGLVVTQSMPAQADAASVAGTNGYLVAWTEGTYGNQRRLLGGRIDDAGNALDGSGIALDETRGIFDQPKIVFDGKRYFVFTQEQNEGDSQVVAFTIDEAGVPASFGFVARPDHSWSEGSYDAAGRDGAVLIAWNHAISGASEIVGALLIDGRLATPVPFVIATGTFPQVLPAIATDEDGFVVVWNELTLDPSPPPCRILCPDPRIPNLRRVHVAMDGTVHGAEIVRDPGGRGEIGGSTSNRLLTYDGGDGVNPMQQLARVDDDTEREFVLWRSPAFSPVNIVYDGVNFDVVTFQRLSESTWAATMTRVTRGGHVLDDALENGGTVFGPYLGYDSLSVATHGNGRGIVTFSDFVDGVPRLFIRTFEDEPSSRRRAIQ